VKRRVALKIIKLGMDTDEVVARFEAERQALALMDHPNIAKVLDAGTTASGKPYFVMELVQGIPITEFCDRNQLTMEERLDIFMDLCRAVQHAHQKGIIHRDLKPSNILVTQHDGNPMPKVIDFGVSKALSQQLTEKTIYTAFGQVIGTRENFNDLLEEGHPVLVFPEGVNGIRKPISQRYRLQHFHVGFVEQALRCRAPIVPMAFIGTDDQAPILYDLKGLAKRLGLPAAPITPTFPWLGPLGLLPYPVSYRIVYGEPLDFSQRFGPEGAQDARLVRYLANQVRGQVRRLIDRHRG